jgi:hypothetical protein
MVDKIMCTEICPCPETTRPMLTTNMTLEEYQNFTMIENGQLYLNDTGEKIINLRNDTRDIL